MKKQKIKEKLIDLLWFDSEEQYYTTSTHSILDEDPDLFTFTVDQLAALFVNLESIT